MLVGLSALFASNLMFDALLVVVNLPNQPIPYRMLVLHSMDSLPYHTLGMVVVIPPTHHLPFITSPVRTCQFLIRTLNHSQVSAQLCLKRFFVSTFQPEQRLAPF